MKHPFAIGSDPAQSDVMRGIDYDHPDLGPLLIICAIVAFLFYAMITATARHEPTDTDLPPPVYSVQEPVSP